MSNNETYDRYQGQSNLIDISSIIDDMWKGLKRYFILLLVIIILCAGGLAGKDYLTYSPYYTASASYNITVGVGSDTYTNKVTAKQLVATTQYILQSGELRTMIQEDLGTSGIPGTIRVSCMEDSNIFTWSVDSADPQMAYDILQSVISNYPKAAKRLLGATNMEQVLDSGVPQEIANPLNLTAQIEKGASIGVIIDFLILLIYALTRHTIQKEEDFKKYLSVECLGAVPKARFKKRGKKGSADRELVLMDNYRVPAGFRESVRTLRSRMERRAVEHNDRVICVTSAIPGEGKSTVAANIALSLALKGHSVVAVDMDLRNPSLGNTLNVKNTHGGTIDLLRERNDLDTVLRRYKKTKLQVIPGGKAINNTSRLLSNGSAEKLVQELKKRFDYVILDTPPCAILSDATIVAPYADGAVFVVRQDYARTDRVVEGVQNLAETGVHIIGCVLNQAQVGVTGYGYSSSYGYGRYGYGHSDKKYGYGYGGYGDESLYNHEPEEAAEETKPDYEDEVLTKEEMEQIDETLPDTTEEGKTPIKEQKESVELSDEVESSLQEGASE